MSRPAFARIHLGHLRHNYRLLKQRAGKAPIMAVIKADAYGHGLHLVAPALLAEGCRCFAVTDADEGTKLRRIIGGTADIVLFSGIFDAADAQQAEDLVFTPVITRTHQLSLLSEAGFSGGVWMKVDTGMNRLGAKNITVLNTGCAARGIKVTGVMSHLACADEPLHTMNIKQAARFLESTAKLPDGIPRSLLNSAGLIALPDCTFDVVRPGIALYGAEPVRNQPLGLQPVMQFGGQIMQLRDVPRGANLSYGATFTAPRDMRIATLSMGYADGLPRQLSNHGAAAVLSQTTTGDTAILDIVGRVCMDYCLLDASQADVKVGTEVEFWGTHIPATRVAEQLGMIAYELFTGVGKRVRRESIE